MVNTSGIITTYAGTGTSGYTGDNGIAQLATFSNPSDISFDAQGNMYIADFVNSAIRKISTAAPPTLSPVSGPSVVCAGTPTLFTTASTGGYWSSSNTSVASVGSYSGYVTGVSAGTADISYSVVSSCATSSVSRPVTINAFSAGTISGPNIVCIGNTITLTSSGGGGTWSSLDPIYCDCNLGGCCNRYHSRGYSYLIFNYQWVWHYSHYRMGNCGDTNHHYYCRWRGINR
jgi:hypothetical protein